MTDSPHIHDPLPGVFSSVMRCMDEAPRRISTRGYISVRLPEHPFRDQLDEILEHRLVVEREIGRFLHASEEVHHKNHDRQDNRPENLELHQNRLSHMRHHSKRFDPVLIQQVREAAADPNMRICDLPVSSVTVHKICKDNNIRWLGADQTHLTEEQVKAALEKTNNTKAAAALLGCSVATLYLNFDHLLNKRKTPGFLDAHMTVVYDMLLNGETIGHVAERFSTNPTTVWQTIRRWSNTGVLPIDVADRLNANPHCKRKLRGTPAAGAGTRASPSEHQSA